MTGHVVGWAFKQKTGSPITKAVLVKLADNANDTGHCYPSIPHLVAHLELSERALREHLKKLEDMGMITVIRRSEGGVNLPSKYQLNLETTFEVVTVVRRGNAPHAVPPMQEAHTGSAPRAEGVVRHVQTEPPLLNPQENPQTETPSTAVAVVAVQSDADLAIDAFNESAENGPKWIKCVVRTANRRKLIEARLKEVGLDGWRAAVARAARSDFLSGRAKRSAGHENWKVDIAWFAKAESFAKIIEGKFDNRTDRNPLHTTGFESALEGLGDFMESRRAH
jgi:DNA-binding transcriptional ArsR family regulator